MLKHKQRQDFTGPLLRSWAPFLCSTGSVGIQTPVSTEAKATDRSTWDAYVEMWKDPEALPSRPRERTSPRAAQALPVSHLGASKAGHGLFQVLSKVQHILDCPFSL